MHNLTIPGEAYLAPFTSLGLNLSAAIPLATHSFGDHIQARNNRDGQKTFYFDLPAIPDK
jgi:hypothetical protein